MTAADNIVWYRPGLRKPHYLPIITPVVHASLLSTLRDCPGSLDEVTVEDPTIYTRPWTMNIPKRRAGTGPGNAPRGTTATSVLAPVAKDPYARELWEVACYEGNTESVKAMRDLGFKWFGGVFPPK